MLRFRTLSATVISRIGLLLGSGLQIMERIFWVTVMLLFLISAPLLHAQTYPTKLLRLIVPFPPGAGVDIVSRTVMPRLSEVLGQQIIIDNRAGAGGIIGAELAAKSANDGYTILMATAGMLTIIPHMQSKLPYSVERDFIPVSLVASVPSMLVVHPSLPVRTVHDFVTLARNRPGVINYASTGNGTLPHLAAEFLRIQAKVKLVHVAYKGSAPAMTDLLGGEVEIFFGNVLSVLPMVNAGRLRALAVTSLQRQSVSPKVPTVAESGFPGFEVVTWFGLMLPGATQRDIVVKLQNEMIKVTKLPDIQEKLSVQGASTIGNTSEQFAAYIKTESDKWAKVLKVSGIKIEQ